MQAMNQKTFAEGSFESYRKPTRREKFLSEMDTTIPWHALYELLEPCYPKAGNGRRPVGLEKVLRLDFLRH
jgi:transposase, IS5 family